jgi:hypothetical protein
MIHILLANKKFTFFLKLAGALALGLLLFTSAAKASGPYPWSDNPDMQSDYQREQRGFNPSPGSGDGYNSWQRRQEAFDRQAEEYRQESMRQYRATPPADANKWNFPEQVITPQGTFLCTNGFQGTTYCH